MKYRRVFILLFSLLLTAAAFAQHKQNIGADYNYMLNNDEADFLNTYFLQQRGDFDFTNKKVGYAFAANKFRIHKNYFFNILNDTTRPKTFELLILRPSLKIFSGGYDAIILVCSNKNCKINEHLLNQLLEEFSDLEKKIPPHLFDLGIDEKPLLNEYEAQYFNRHFENNDFDFSNKKLLFLYGDRGEKQQTKKDYFDSVKDKILNNNNPLSDALIVFSRSEKSRSRGYDAAVFVTNKNIDESMRAKVVKSWAHRR